MSHLNSIGKCVGAIKPPRGLKICPSCCLTDSRPFLWGGCALEHFKARQDLGLLLWKQPGPQEVLDQVERELMQASSRHFPLEAGLEVCFSVYVEVSSCEGCRLSM